MLAMMGRRTYDFSVETSVSPERLLGAASDFSALRPQIWPNVTAKHYKVHDSGETWCDCTEGTGPFWERNKYDWSAPGLIRSEAVSSNIHVPPGRWEMRVGPGATGGSRVDIHVERTFRGVRGVVVQTIVDLAGGGRFFKRGFQKTLDRLELEPAAYTA